VLRVDFAPAAGLPAYLSIVRVPLTSSAVLSLPTEAQVSPSVRVWRMVRASQCGPCAFEGCQLMLASRALACWGRAPNDLQHAETVSVITA
jgi:hypothetical protein